MLFKPLRGCALFRSPTSKSQFTKYVFGSEDTDTQTHFFFAIRRTLPLSRPSPPPPYVDPCAIENSMLSFLVKCSHEVECKMATVLIRGAHAVNCVEQSVPFGDKSR